MGIMSAIIGWLSYHLGLRTDAADATGSLHAKIKNIGSNQLGDSSDVRADNTVLGWLATGVKSWQRVTFTPDSNSYAVTITSVNPAKCQVVLNGSAVKIIKDSESADTGGYAISYYVSGFAATTLTVSPSFSSPTMHGICSAIIVEYY